ncbi:MAG: hypothetical protein AYL33_001750 [Candidatus Bathyarchaeota archaeon B63]|nr:MAG: hypothetical protein AYL33_001750 [Candidatus Bathyarchaeota archaeon B63]
MEDEIKIIILDKLRKRGCWGGRYTPLDSLVRWLGKRIRGNGRRVRVAISQLVNEGYLILHKRGKTVSLNPTRSREIIKFIERK